jgi:hypothetical protein
LPDIIAHLECMPGAAAPRTGGHHFHLPARCVRSPPLPISDSTSPGRRLVLGGTPAERHRPEHNAVAPLLPAANGRFCFRRRRPATRAAAPSTEAPVRNASADPSSSLRPRRTNQPPPHSSLSLALRNRAAGSSPFVYSGRATVLPSRRASPPTALSLCSQRRSRALRRRPSLSAPLLPGEQPSPPSCLPLPLCLLPHVLLARTASA